MRRVTSLALVGFLPLTALVAGCGGNQTTASKSAAEFDAAQRKGAALKAGEAHGGHGQADAADSPAAGRATGASNTEGMDHSRMPGMAGAPAARPTPARAGSSMAGMDHSRMPGMGSAATARPAPPAMDHSTMAGRPAMATAPPTPERPASVALPGQPAATLRPDEIDSPAPTAVREAARSAEIAMQMAGGGGHGMLHGTYRQIDAGREDVPSPPQEGHEDHQVAPPPPSSSADPHAGHAAPRPRPTPSPRPKEDNR